MTRRRTPWGGRIRNEDGTVNVEAEQLAAAVGVALDAPGRRERNRRKRERKARRQ